MIKLDMSRSLSLRFNGSCPPGFHKRKSYISKRGHRVSARCVRSTTPYKQTSAEFKRSVTQKQHRRMASHMGTAKACSPGKILRAPYVRKFGSTVRTKGYTRKLKSGKVIRIIPKAVKTILVSAACINDRGKKGKGTQKIGPLRKGELSKYGYSTRLPRDQRHAALRKAIDKLGSNNVYHKLDAVTKLSVRTDPKRSHTFSIDRDWVKNQFGIKVF